MMAGRAEPVEAEYVGNRPVNKEEPGVAEP